jgi:Kef-type K+ transport system membrane component KefB
VVEFFLAILVMLASAWLLGEGMQRVGQPALVGQLLAGILVGPSVLGLVQPSASLTSFETVALFFIMLLTGLAVKPSKIFAAGRKGMMVSSISFVIPFVAGYEVASLFGISFVSALTTGLAVSITAVPVNSIILMELGILDTQLGSVVIAAGVVDDIIAFLALSMIQQFARGNLALGGGVFVAFALTKAALFLCAFFLCENLVRSNLTRVHRQMDRFATYLRTPGSYILMVLVIAIGISLLAEWSGMQLVIGTFFAGLLLSDLAASPKLEQASNAISRTTFGFFGPFAFAFIGTELALASLSGKLVLLSSLLAVAVASKLFGGYAGARISKFDSAQSLAIGFLMNSRGFIELVIAATAYQLGLIDQTLFSIVVGFGIITTVISPIASRLTLKRAKVSPATLQYNARESDNAVDEI